MVDQDFYETGFLIQFLFPHAPDSLSRRNHPHSSISANFKTPQPSALLALEFDMSHCFQALLFSGKRHLFLREQQATGPVSNSESQFEKPVLRLRQIRVAATRGSKSRNQLSSKS